MSNTIFICSSSSSTGSKLPKVEKTKKTKTKSMVVVGTRNPVFCRVSSEGMNQIKKPEVVPSLGFGFSTWRSFPREKGTSIPHIRCSQNQSRQLVPYTNVGEKKLIKKAGNREHHLWMKRDSAGSGQKALNLVRIVCELPNEKEAVYGALDKWTAWEAEFPLIAAAKALQILRKRNQWMRVIQQYRAANLKQGHKGKGESLVNWQQFNFFPCHVLGKSLSISLPKAKQTDTDTLKVAPLGPAQVAKWMLSKGQGATMGTYDTLLLAFDMDQRVDEAESLWNMILHTHTRSISKQLFSRMVSLYDHHNMQDKIIEVFADMEELGVKPDEDTVRRVARAFQKIGQEDKQKLVLRKYQCKWKYIHFKGERVRVKKDAWDE